MTEKEKMLSGQLYDANDAALARERDRATKLCRAYNELSRRKAAQALPHRQGVLDRAVVLVRLWRQY